MHRLLAPTVAALLFVPCAAVAQAPVGQPVAIRGDGTELFRGLLDYAGIKPVTQQEMLNLRPDQWNDIIFISLGSTTTWNSLQRGAVLIATDGPLDLPNGVNCPSSKVQCTDKDAIHRKDPYCPYVVPVEMDIAQGPFQIFTGLNRIATNRPSYLTRDRVADFATFELARLPPNCWTGFGQIPRNATFAVGSEARDGWGEPTNQTLVMADHSIFINQMLLEPGTDNWELAWRVIKYLQGPNKRMRCAFFENGRQIERFDDLRQAYARQNQQALPQVNLMAMQEKLTDFGNAIVDRLQTNNVFNNAVLGTSDRDNRLNVIARGLLIIATVMACFFLLRRVWRTRKPGDIMPPPPVAGAPSGPPGVFDRRQKELLRRNNVFEPVSERVREFFESIGIHGETMTRPPKIVIADIVRKPDSLRAAVKDFWRLAYGEPQVLTISRWRELEPFFARVRQAHADQKWRFVTKELTAGSVA
jgi:hypothetical protein